MGIQHQPVTDIEDDCPGVRRDPGAVFCSVPASALEVFISLQTPRSGGRTGGSGTYAGFGLFSAGASIIYRINSCIIASFVCFLTDIGRTFRRENDIIHSVKRKESAPQRNGVWLPGWKQKEDIMNKVSAFFKNCWSDYVDFMGKYGEYVNRF